MPKALLRVPAAQRHQRSRGWFESGPRSGRFPLNGDGRKSEPATVYMDGFTGALYLDKPSEVERYAEAFGGIWDACLDETASRDLIHHAAEEL